MIEQAPIDQKEDKPDDKPAPPTPSLGTGIKGDGPDGFGLNNSGDGTIGGNGHRNSRWGWYGGQVQTAIQEALGKNPRTRNASFRFVARIWPDTTGRIRRVDLKGSSGDPSIDALIKGDILTGFQLQEAPPAGMPMPIVLRLTGRRPL